jgi:hypothetical protein
MTKPLGQKDWQKLVNEKLKEKIIESQKSFETKEAEDIKKLIELSEQLHDFQIKKEVAEGNQKEESLKFIPNNGVLNDAGKKIFYCERNIRSLQRQIDELFKKLTIIDKSIESNIPFILKLNEMMKG